MAFSMKGNKWDVIGDYKVFGKKPKGKRMRDVVRRLKKKVHRFARKNNFTVNRQTGKVVVKKWPIEMGGKWTVGYKVFAEKEKPTD